MARLRDKPRGHVAGGGGVELSLAKSPGGQLVATQRATPGVDAHVFTTRESHPRSGSAAERGVAFADGVGAELSQILPEQKITI